MAFPSPIGHLALVLDIPLDLTIIATSDSAHRAGPAEFFFDVADSGSSFDRIDEGILRVMVRSITG